MTDPFEIAGPAVISVSGGRTSGEMLRRIAAHGLRPHVHVLFANTGKEIEATLVFVRQCAEHFGVTVRWLEWRPSSWEEVDALLPEIPEDRLQALSRILKPRPGGFEEVDFHTAHRDGEPFEALIALRRILPNPVIRYCSTELKVRPMKQWMIAQGYVNWTNVVGLRADEQGRIDDALKNEHKERWYLSFPLAEAGIRKNDVLLAWKKQPFDLQLRDWEGNCDGCMLKSVRKRVRMFVDHPEPMEWWPRQEALAARREGVEPNAALFKMGTPYAALQKRAGLERRQGLLFEDMPESDVDLPCLCGT